MVDPSGNCCLLRQLFLSSLSFFSLSLSKLKENVLPSGKYARFSGRTYATHRSTIRLIQQTFLRSRAFFLFLRPYTRSLQVATQFVTTDLIRNLIRLHQLLIDGGRGKKYFLNVRIINKEN